MSIYLNNARITVPHIRQRKGHEKIVCLTAYSTPIARLLDPLVDVLLVGDSVGMVVHGMPTTIGVTLEMMIMHGQAVVRGATRALVVVDLPFGSYERSKEQAYDNAVRVMRETGCHAVKLEVNEYMAETVEFLVKRGVPVMGHIGLRPQSVNADGGFKIKGRLKTEREQIVKEAHQLADAGAFAIVVEGVLEELAREITLAVCVPTIGIGASRTCDGQILVVDDMLGLFERTPKFVRSYGTLREHIQHAVALYASDVKSGAFPTSAECYQC
ncbi:3-methyl-2-oxobutanoate hydroxymethyltransferase [Pseudomonas sp. W4I3]|uniref:3-methyl-2-oxobutanoate hydroxymethyltransferase n=1 Tax=Pseudomonas sp. W4I3 TaxID=3042294 RepID=UPI0027810B88|nr:3-methyl-2-oxobutanoate hydroxymethyltransferase [Pseudomonas sp. W4I3]MDQ0740306.1 3-methyl-2-oxobutanoate hydroxymethyltransferase [Pseudomonas sp. W4I3]